MYAEAGGRGRGHGGGQTRFCFFGHAAPSGRAHWLGRGELPSPETLMENKTSNNNVSYTFSCTCNRNPEGWGSMFKEMFLVLQ